eukprot:scaffold5176_cov84-Phaeocystis_antarctica.AAC.1
MRQTTRPRSHPSCDALTFRRRNPPSWHARWRRAPHCAPPSLDCTTAQPVATGRGGAARWSAHFGQA